MILDDDDDDGQMIFGEPWGPKASRHLTYRWGKPQKNLSQENRPDRGSNPGPLRDRRACYLLAHSGGLFLKFTVDYHNIKVTVEVTVEVTVTLVTVTQLLLVYSNQVTFLASNCK